MKVKKPNFFRIRIETDRISQTKCCVTFPGNTLVAFGDVTVKSGMVIKNYKSVRLLSKLHLFNNKIQTELRKLNR